MRINPFEIILGRSYTRSKANFDDKYPSHSYFSWLVHYFFPRIWKRYFKFKPPVNTSPTGANGILNGSVGPFYSYSSNLSKEEQQRIQELFQKVITNKLELEKNESQKT